MTDSAQCEYCSRPIKGDSVKKVLRGESHTFCSEFCFRLYFYDVPTISYEDMKEMYALRCISVTAPDVSEESRSEVRD